MRFLHHMRNCRVTRFPSILTVALLLCVHVLLTNALIKNHFAEQSSSKNVASSHIHDILSMAASRLATEKDVEVASAAYKGLMSTLQAMHTDYWVLLYRLLHEINDGRHPIDQYRLLRVEEVQCSCFGTAGKNDLGQGCLSYVEKTGFEPTSALANRLANAISIYGHNVMCADGLDRTEIESMRTSFRRFSPLSGKCNLVLTLQSLSKGIQRFKVRAKVPPELATAHISTIPMNQRHALLYVPVQIHHVVMDSVPYSKAKSNVRQPPMAFNRNVADLGLPFNNGSKSLSELYDLASFTKCTKDHHGLCIPGTVDVSNQADRAYLSTLDMQMNLQADMPLNYVNILQTHNSFNQVGDIWESEILFMNWIHDALFNITSKFDRSAPWEWVWQQQFYSVTDQLNFGVRGMMFDPWYVFGDVRVCHAGTRVDVIDKVIHLLEDLLHIKINFTSYDIGCTPYDKLLAPALQEVVSWIDEQDSASVQKFVHVEINDEGPKASCGHVAEIQNIVAAVFGHRAFTPAEKRDKFRDKWPSLHQLVANNRSVMIRGDGRTGNDYIFTDMTTPFWSLDTVTHFSEFPSCGGYGPGQWAIFGGESQNNPPFWYGPAQYGLVNTHNILTLQACGISFTGLDLASPALLQTAVWTWSPEIQTSDTDIIAINKHVSTTVFTQSVYWRHTLRSREKMLRVSGLQLRNPLSHAQESVSDSSLCFVLDASVKTNNIPSPEGKFGRWRVTSCTLKLQGACWVPSNSNPSSPMGQVAGSWIFSGPDGSDGVGFADVQCPSGSYFVPPATAYQNRRLADALGHHNHTQVWLGIAPFTSSI